jgi:hypothetical protein
MAPATFLIVEVFAEVVSVKEGTRKRESTFIPRNW